MPVQYPDGILQGHLHCRTKASLFDVSHMGQIKVEGKDRVKFVERLTVADVAGLPLNTAVYSLFTNKNGGIIDDTIIANRGDFIYIVVNAGCFDKDWAHIQAEVYVYLLTLSHRISS
jgi:aminomethyltransferase